MATIDTFKTAPADIEAQKKAILQAVAEGGTAGKAAYDQAQAQVQAQRDAAVSGALARANAINAPDAFVQTARTEASAPHDLAISGLASQNATFQQDMARQQATGTTYLDKVSAAIPIVNAQSQTEIANTLTQAEQETQARQDALMQALQDRLESARQRTFDQSQREAAAKLAAEQHGWSVDDRAAQQKLLEEQHGWAVTDRGADQAWTKQEHAMAVELAKLQLRQAQASAARAASSGSRGNYAGAGNPLADLVHSLGTTGVAKTQLKTATQQAIKGQRAYESQVRSNSGNTTAKSLLPGFNPGGGSTVSHMAPPSGSGAAVSSMSRKAIVDAVGQTLGLGPGELDAFLGKDSPAYKAPKGAINAKKFPPQVQQNLRSKPDYARESKEIIDGLQELRVPTGKRGDKDYVPAMDLSTAKSQVAAQIRSQPGYAKQPMLYELLISDLLSR